MAIVRPIGQPENESERKAIAYFRDHLSDDNYILFHNLDLRSHNVPNEFDIVIVGERAVYPIEVKGYSGRIIGNASEWEFENGSMIESPIRLSNKKTRVLASAIHRIPMLDRVFVEPTLVILTDDGAEIDLDDESRYRVMHLDQAIRFIRNDTRESIVDLHDRIVNAVARQFQPLHRANEIGEYVVKETLSQNELYSTYLAEHRLLPATTRFMLKVYHLDLYAEPQEQERQRAWILRDSNALLRLEGHPNIVQAHPPFPWQSNQIVLPLDWVDGYSLRGLLKSQKPLAFRSKIEIARQVCKGLKHAHTNGVIHRDLCPENIIVSRKGTVKLTNFDCARIEGGGLATIASRVGQHLDEHYLAPEVWQDPANASRSSDIYAAGILLYELFVGKTPYDRMQEVLTAKGLPKKPSDAGSNLSPEFDVLMVRMCAFDAASRTATLDDAIQYLERLKTI